MISLRSPLRWQLLSALLVIAPFARSVGQSCPATKKDEMMPLKYVGPATKPEVTACDLMARLYIYADDSMMGRKVGTEDNMRATAYLEREVRRLGLTPAGDNGGYFQDIGLVSRALDSTSTITVEGVVLHAGVDFLVTTGGRAHQLGTQPVIVLGSLFDTLNVPTLDQVAGRVVLYRAVPPPTGVNMQEYSQSAGYRRVVEVLNSPRLGGRIIVGGAQIPPAVATNAFHPTNASMTSKEELPVYLTVIPSAAQTIAGVPLTDLRPGSEGKSLVTDLRWTETPRGGRNVVAILPGSDSKLKGQYIAIGAHNDHIGAGRNVAPNGEHDSLKVWNAVGRPAGAEGGRTTPITADEWTKINADIAELRKKYPARQDSIANGADDDGTGSVSVLELAEAAAKGKIKPKRSLLFIWHTGEESGMWGSGYFMDHPTVPRDSIVAELNIDMVGRGAASDVTGQKKEGGILHGGDHYVQLVGSRRLSTELGDLVEKVNTDKKHNFLFDYAIDADGHPQNIYCRSDHWSYGKWGVPVVFFTTGGHADYHQVTDEPQYIRYEHMAALDNLILDLAETLANLDHRVVVDKPKPNPAPAVACRQ